MSEEGTNSFPKYRCHKVVCAGQITSIVRRDDLTACLQFEEPLPDAEVSPQWMAKHNPEICGYYVVYSDGYSSYSPKEQFENGYRLVVHPAGEFAQSSTDNRDRKAICEIMSDMLDSPSENGIFSTGVFMDRMQQYVEQERCQAVGWMYAEACIIADDGKDIREVLVPSILNKALDDLVKFAVLIPNAINEEESKSLYYDDALGDTSCYAFRVTNNLFDCPHPNDLHIKGFVYSPSSKTVSMGDKIATMGHWFIAQIGRGEQIHFEDAVWTPMSDDSFKKMYTPR